MSFQGGGYTSDVDGSTYAPVSGKRMDVTVDGSGNLTGLTYSGGSVTNLSGTTSTGAISFTVTVGANVFNFSGTYTSSTNSFAGTCSKQGAPRRGPGPMVDGSWTAGSGPIPRPKPPGRR